MLKNYNINPYFDDYDDDKSFHRMLFKPSFAVQARELTQIQSILQDQVKRFGNHIFKNGSVVTGGQFFNQVALSLKVNDEYSNVAISVGVFDNKTILSLDETKRAEVIKVYDTDEGTGDPKTLIVKQLYGDPFQPGEVLKTTDSDPYYVQISANGVSDSRVFSVNEGVFYYDGFFIKAQPQTIALSKYTSANVSAKIGFDIEESVVDYFEDTSLLDPALGSSNYQAPGADRLKLDLILNTRPLDTEDDEAFIELSRVEESIGTIKENRDPIYAILEDSLARKIYDESGNYIVDPFEIRLENNSSNTAQTNIILSPGKAYVYGYEIVKNSPTIITVDKPRETGSISNRRVSSEYGNFVYTKNHYGTFALNSLDTVDLHCVPRSNINFSSAGTISNTKIGTARVKSFEFDSFQNESISSTYVYRTFLFDINVNNTVRGNVVSSSIVNGKMELTIGSGGSLYSDEDSAYVGARVRIVAGPGSAEPPKTIESYDGFTRTLTLAQPFFVTPGTNSIFSIEFDFRDTESIVSLFGNTLQDGADIDDRSKDLSKINQDAFISETDTETLIFPIGQNFIVPNSITDMSYDYKRVYLNYSFSANVSTPLPVESGEELNDANAASRKAQFYYVTVKQQNLSPYPVGSLIPVDKITDINPVARTITIQNAFNMVADITTTISDLTPTFKAKQLVQANTSHVASVSGQNVYSNSAVIVYGSEGQTHIAQSFVNKNPNLNQSLFVSDVLELVAVKDFNGKIPSTANVSTSIDVTSKYTLDNGQRDSFYDHASIKLKPATKPPVGPLVVYYNRFKSTGPGFFTLDSYSGIDYGKIPIYSSPKTNSIFALRDCLDFRPVRFDAVTGSGNSVSFDVNSGTTGPKIPDMSSNFILDYSYYLPRIDRVVLDKNSEFNVIKGTAKLNPSVPIENDTSMSLYILKNGSFVANTEQVRIEYINNKRYTMKDIGNIEQRVQNLEYYTSLSLLEQDAINRKDLSILDSDNLPRFKNGILVDAFTGSSVADVTDVDFRASIDSRRQEMRPSFNIYSYSLQFDAANSSGYLQQGSLIVPEASSVIFVDQPKTSRSINVNPFNVVNFLGRVKLNPTSDIWFDITRQPDVTVDLTGDREAYALLFQSANELLATQVDWGSWEISHTGTELLPNGGRREENLDVQNNRTANWQVLNAGIGGANDIVRHTTQIQDTVQTRDGILTQLIPQTITRSLGDRVVDISVIHYMRTINILFTGTVFKPSTILYPFFDNLSVVSNTGNRVNKFYVTENNINYVTDFADPETAETVTIRDGSSVVGTGIVVLTSNNIVYVTNVIPTAPFTNANTNFNITGNKTGKIYQVTGYEHNAGNVTFATSTTITLRQDARGAKNSSSFLNNKIRIVQGVGEGQERTITAYNSTTGSAIISPAWTTIPDVSSIYSIGDLKTDEFGSVAGIFTVPEGKFKVGEKQFRLVDNASGDIGSSSTNGDSSFFAQGLLKTVEETIVSTTVPQKERSEVNDQRIVPVSLGTPTRNVIWTDPLAQTFLISPLQFPQGLFLQKIRVCFKSKDETIPITLQLRPVVNGYPSSSVIYPFSTVTLTPDKIKITEFPNIDDPTKYTEFNFSAPIYMQPGEHSFILLANSNKYEIYTAVIGNTDLVTNRLISEQPYGGSLFLSQNGSTWTADQTSDMMFRLYRYTFSVAPAVAQFLVDFPDTTPIPYDLTHLITSDVSLTNTQLNYEFNSEALTGNYVGYKPISPFSDYDMNDGGGTRALTPSKGEESFILNAYMRTVNPDIAPFLDISRIGFLAVHNQINNLELSNSNIVIVSGGSGYANSDDVFVTISGGNGADATAKANVVNGVINEIYIEDAGSGYSETPTITITSGSGGGSGAQAVIMGETSKRGGPAKARYISKRVTLADGFESGDLRVYLTVYKPVETNVLVYAKYLAQTDPESFEDKEWQLLTPLGNANFVSTSESDYRELVYAPGSNGVESNSISYTSLDGSTYGAFKTFAIKVVLTSTSSTVVPKVRNFRAIAYPAERQ